MRIDVSGESTTAEVDPADSGSGDVVFVCAHGAGGHMRDRAILAVTSDLCRRGVTCVRFNFLYRERRSARPDPMPRLVACLDAVATHARRDLQPRRLILGGRSMGGRAASVFAAEGGACDALLLLAYPLHPPGQPEKLRTAHLASIRVPVLCINGTRDSFCDPALMRQALSSLGPNWRMHWLEGADHGFHVLKRSGRDDRQVTEEVGEVVQSWIP